VLLGDYASAITTQRPAVETKKAVATDAVADRRDLAIKSTWLAIALAKGGRAEEAVQVVRPVVAFEREMAAKNLGDAWVSVELAGALYAEALADKTQSAAMLQEAAKLLDATVPSVRTTHDVRQIRTLVREAAKI
jgi:hypothetical protein